MFDSRFCLTLLMASAVLHSYSLHTAPADDTAFVRITPEETDEILANPGVGWETFHRASDHDKNLPAWIPSTIHYIRWGWGELEPERGRIDNDLLDDVLKETRQAGQKLAFRVMCCSTYPRQPYHPRWLRDIGGNVVTTRYGGGPELEVPVLDDPQVLAAHLDFIQRLAASYDGHPDIDHIDLGTVGWWGEWHMSQSSNAPMPTLETQKKIVDAYLAAFQKTPLLMLVGGGEMLDYATHKGTGWRADSLGDMGVFWRRWSHMRNGYPTWLAEANALDAWKQGPVAWETGGDMRQWVFFGFSLRFIFNYALALHGSVINNKSAPLPDTPQVRSEIERFLRRLGYRLVLKEMRHPRQTKPGEKLTLSMKWQNVGSAPCYRPYRLAYRLTDADGNQQTFVGNVTIDKWLPGSIELFTEEFFKQPTDLPSGEVVAVEDSIRLPDNLASGCYTLSIGIVGEDGQTPVVRLGIKGRARDGWYPLSEVTISR